MKRAILDLGTNTFHLLIIEVNHNINEMSQRGHPGFSPGDPASFEILYKAEKFVKLAEESISHIGDKAFARGINQLKEYKEVIEQHHPEKVFAFGTAALRNADNADQFIQAAFAETGIEIKRISGDEEAGLICDGVRQAVTFGKDPELIMDIGGGSTEFIFANQSEIFWKQSFPVGASVLKQRFHHTEPISIEEKKKLIDFLEKELTPLFEQRKNYSVQHLIGASGSFDSFASMISIKRGVPVGNRTSFEMKLEELHSIFSQLEKATLDERLKMNGLLAFRAEMIVVAALLTEVVLNHFPVGKISQSSFALKEGVLSRILKAI